MGGFLNGHFGETSWECEICHDWKTCSTCWTSLWFYPDLQSEEAADCRSEGWHMVRQRVESSAKRERGFSWEWVERDHWWKPEKEQGSERCLEELQPGLEEGMRELNLGPHVGCDRKGSLRAMSGDVLGYHRKRVWWAGQGVGLSKSRDMSRDMALISCLPLRISIHCWESRSIILWETELLIEFIMR